MRAAAVLDNSLYARACRTVKATYSFGQVNPSEGLGHLVARCRWRLQVPVMQSRKPGTGAEMTVLYQKNGGEKYMHHLRDRCHLPTTYTNVTGLMRFV